MLRGANNLNHQNYIADLDFLQVWDVTLRFRRRDLETAFWSSSQTKDKLCAIDRMALLTVVINNVGICLLFKEEYPSVSKWYSLCALLFVVLQLIALREMQTDKERYCSHRTWYQLVQRLSRLLAFYAFYVYMSCFAPIAVDAQSGMNFLVSNAHFVSHIREYVTLSKWLLIKTGFFIVSLPLVNFPVNFRLQLLLHSCALPCMLLSSLATGQRLRHSDLWHAACSSYEVLRRSTLVPCIQSSPGAECQCPDNAGVVLAVTVGSEYGRPLLTLSPRLTQPC